MSRSELVFWRQSFLAAELSVLLGGNAQKLNPAGAAHLSAEYANAAVNELRRAKNGGAS
jgi:hypothetical protein